MSVVMKSDTRALDEVVVTGMFNRKKEGFTGSAVTIKGEDLKKYSTNNVAKAIAAPLRFPGKQTHTFPAQPLRFQDLSGLLPTG